MRSIRQRSTNGSLTVGRTLPWFSRTVISTFTVVGLIADVGHRNQNTSCQVTLMLVDSEKPVPACKTTTVQLGNNGTYDLLTTDVFNGGSDNCSILVSFINMSPVSVSCPDLNNTVIVPITSNDCNGETDEGISGGFTWTGKVLITTQAAVGDWLSCYTIIDGNLIIQGAGIDSLEVIGGGLTIYFNSSLKSLAGLESLDTIGVNLMTCYNFALNDACSICGLLNNSGSIGGSTVIFFNAAGASSVADINVTCAPQAIVANPNGSMTVEGYRLEADDKSIVEEVDLKLFPNPGARYATLQFDRAISSATVTVSDMTGRTILQREIEQGSSQSLLDVSG